MEKNRRTPTLHETLLEIEWMSRRRPTMQTLRAINALARAALVDTHEPPTSASLHAPTVEAVSGPVTALKARWRDGPIGLLLHR